MPHKGLSVPFVYHLALRCQSCKNQKTKSKNICGANYPNLYLTINKQIKVVIAKKLRPLHFSRDITCIIVGLVYHSPSTVDGPILKYLYNCVFIIKARFSGCGTIPLSDFNKTLGKKSLLSNSIKLKQLVNIPIRGTNMLDPVLQLF